MTLDREPSRRKQASIIKIRCVITVMAVLCPIVCYIARQNLSLAIISIVNETPEVTASTIVSTNQTTSHNDLVSICEAPTTIGENGQEVQVAAPISYGPKYDWTAFEKALTFQAFFATYVLFQIPGARVAESIGAKWILFTAAAGSSILSLMSPWMISLHVLLYSLVRALMGVCQAALYPALYVLLTHWLPPVERSQAFPVLGCGAFIGATITSSATGFFSESPSFGWPYAFYMPGVLCAIWAAVWVFIGSSNPQEHKLISLEELNYIESKMEVKLESLESEKRISWLKLLNSQHIWAFALTYFASNWAFTIVLLQIPTYLSSILRLPPMKNGFVNSIIYILFCVSSPIVGTVSTLMIETRPCGISRLTTRKLFQCIGVFSQTFCFIALTIIGCDLPMALTILYVQIVLYSFVNGGEVQLASDLSLDFAGTIYAIANCVGSSTGVIVPYVNSLMVTHRDQGEWFGYFILAAAITASGGLVFLLFGRNDQQDFSVDSQLCDSQVDNCKWVKHSNLDLELQDPTARKPENDMKNVEGDLMTMTI